MSSGPKKGFASFLRPVQDLSPPAELPAPPPLALVPDAPPSAEAANPVVGPVVPAAGPPPVADRIRTVTPTGRVRTHSANRQQPGVTFRLTEERWERLKMLSIQERRPIQDIIGDAMDAYMKGRGLPW